MSTLLHVRLPMEIFSDSSLEQPCAASAASASRVRRRDSKANKVDGRRVSIKELVRRPCKCSAGDCFQQYAGKVSDVEECRSELEALELPMRDIHIELLFNLRERVPIDVAIAERRETFKDSADEFSDSSCDATLPIQASGVDSAFEDSLEDSDQDVELAATTQTSITKLTRARLSAARKYKVRQGSGRKAHVFLGSPVCQWALQKLYGIGDSTIQVLRGGGRTRRPGDRVEPKHKELGFSLLQKSHVLWPSVLGFFWMLYHTTAEGLPEGVVNMESLMDASKVNDEEGWEIEPVPPLLQIATGISTFTARTVFVVGGEGEVPRAKVDSLL